LVYRAVAVCGVSLIFLGQIIIFHGIFAAIWHRSDLLFTGQGIWGGLFILITGSFGALASDRRTRAQMQTFRIFSTLALFVICPITIILSDHGLNPHWTCHQKCSTSFTNSEGETDEEHRCELYCKHVTQRTHNVNLSTIILTSITMLIALISLILSAVALRRAENRIDIALKSKRVPSFIAYIMATSAQHHGDFGEKSRTVLLTSDGQIQNTPSEEFVCQRQAYTEVDPLLRSGATRKLNYYSV